MLKIKNQFTYMPDIAIHPGRTLEEEMQFLHISNKDLSIKAGISEKHISQIINGDASITVDVAIKIERVVGLSANSLLNLQSQYDINVNRINELQKLESEIEKSKKYNYLELMKLGLVKNTRDLRERVNELQKYFGVTSLDIIPNIPSMSFRNINNSINMYSLQSWIRFGEIKADTLINDFKMKESFDKNKLKSNITNFKKLIGKDHFFKDLQNMCQECGVLLVYTPYFKNTKAHGAARWYRDIPLIQLNSKGVYNDSFWFTFFHEVGHILLHGKKERFLDYDKMKNNTEEQEADDFAMNCLIDKDIYEEIISTNSINDAINICKREKVDFSVLIGRLAHDNHISWANASRFRRKIEIK